MSQASMTDLQSNALGAPGSGMEEEKYAQETFQGG